MLWSARFILLISVVMHAWAAIQLTAVKAAARPVAYVKPGNVLLTKAGDVLTVLHVPGIDFECISRAELDELLARGAVGDIALRYFDRDGHTVESEINDRIIGITLEQLKRGPRVVAVSGGPQKAPSIRAALRGGLIDVLVTDSVTAGRLLDAGDG